jgi:hypothetical protein
VFSGGTSTGTKVEDRCDTFVKIDALVFGNTTNAGPDPRNCRTVEPFRTTFRGLASYTLPKVGVLVSASMRSLPGPALTANYNVPNTVIQQQIGRLPAGGTANGNVTVNLLRTNERYAEDRINQVDMRFAKILRLSRMRVDLGVDLYNLFNTNDATAYDGTYDFTPAAGLGPGGEWLRPTTIVQPRFVRLNVTVDF